MEHRDTSPDDGPRSVNTRPHPTHLELGNLITPVGREFFPADLRGLYEHPTDPSKLIRHEGTGLYISVDHMNETLLLQEAFLSALNSFGIRHANPQYLPELTEDGKIDMYTVVDKIEGVPMEALMDMSIEADIPTEHYDDLISRLITYVHHVTEHGGIFTTEMLRLEQYMYDTANASFVLVDVEPHPPEIIVGLEHAPDNYTRIQTANTARFFVSNALRDVARVVDDTSKLVKTHHAADKLKSRAQQVFQR